MRFALDARLEFTARNLDDAFRKISDYFRSRAEGKTSRLDCVGEVHMHRLEVKNDKSPRQSP